MWLIFKTNLKASKCLLGDITVTPFTFIYSQWMFYHGGTQHKSSQPIMVKKQAKLSFIIGQTLTSLFWFRWFYVEQSEILLHSMYFFFYNATATLSLYSGWCNRAAIDLEVNVSTWSATWNQSARPITGWINNTPTVSQGAPGSSKPTVCFVSPASPSYLICPAEDTIKPLNSSSCGW